MGSCRNIPLVYRFFRIGYWGYGGLYRRVRQEEAKTCLLYTSKDYDTAQCVLGNVFVLNMVLGIAFTIIVMLFQMCIRDRYGRIDTQVVCFGSSPFFVAVVVIVFGTLLVRFVHHLLRFTLRNWIHSANTLDALLIGAGNEDIGLSLIHIWS